MGKMNIADEMAQVTHEALKQMERQVKASVTPELVTKALRPLAEKGLFEASFLNSSFREIFRQGTVVAFDDHEAAKDAWVMEAIRDLGFEVRVEGASTLFIVIRWAPKIPRNP